MAQKLTTGTNTGSQSTTQNLQAPVGDGTNTAKSSNVQPGTASNVLLSTNGLTLQDRQLPAVNLAGVRHSTVSVFMPPPTRHISPLLFGFSGLLFIAAVAMFWATARSSKNTTD